MEENEKTETPRSQPIVPAETKQEHSTFEELTEEIAIQIDKQREAGFSTGFTDSEQMVPSTSTEGSDMSRPSGEDQPAASGDFRDMP